MDVRCEKCQTEYELDEARLKPGGVTVKCTNCGHMFKIRKRSITNVGAPPPGERARTQSSKPPGGLPRADSMLSDEAPTRQLSPDDGPTAVERQWVIRLENGEQKSCRELATLQQWIVAGVVTRESLISRTGKTWKRLGDIAELAQYFDIADEARTTRADRTTKPTGPAAGTMLGFGSGPAAAGGTILPDDDETEGRTTGNFRTHPAGRPPTQPPPAPGSVRTPPMGSNAAPPAASATPPTRRPATTPPPPPAKKPGSQSSPLPQALAQTALAAPSVPSVPPVPSRPAPAPDGRSTAMWASDPVKADMPQSGPFGGKISAIPDEPAFAGRVRVAPSDESSFSTGKVTSVDDDDDFLPRRGGSRAGLLILVLTLLVGGAAAAVVYVFVIKKDPAAQVATPTADAADVQTPDAAAVVVTASDAAEAPAPSALETARGELATNHEARLRAAFDSLAGNEEPGALALRAHLGVAIAQAQTDRAGLVADKAEADKLRKDSKAIVIEAATAAQKALRAAPADAAANLAMASVLRLQGKPARDLKRYLDIAKAKAGPEWTRDVALAEALVLARDGKLDDANAAFAAIEQGEGKLATSNDVRAVFHLALIAHLQKRTADAKGLVAQLLAAQPEHPGARALSAKLETAVATTDPLPPEDNTGKTGSGTTKPPPDQPITGSYDSLLARANALAETNCTKAIDMYLKALEQKPNGVEALTGMGYCHIDAKQFASAFSKFRAALAVSSRYEPALWGVAEAYQQQGRKEQAIEAYKAYLEVYPDTAKAKKQLERLGGDGGANGGGTGSAAPPPPAPTPTPTPAPEAPASGSG